MKKAILSLLFLSLILTVKAQTIQLPGVGSNQINVASADVNSTAHFTFGNPEYNVTGFTISFPTSSDPHYTATSSNNQFTGDMLAHFSELVSGSHIDLQVILQAPGEGHLPWTKNYILQMN